MFVNETKPASAHDLRRSFGQRLADAGVLPRDLQAIMRHKHFSTTEKYYLTHRGRPSGANCPGSQQSWVTHARTVPNKKRKRRLLMSRRKSLISKKYQRRDLNPHALNGHWILNPARLPIPPLWLIVRLLENIEPAATWMVHGPH